MTFLLLSYNKLDTFLPQQLSTIVYSNHSIRNYSNFQKIHSALDRTSVNIKTDWLSSRQKKLYKPFVFNYNFLNLCIFLTWQLLSLVCFNHHISTDWYLKKFFFVPSYSILIQKNLALGISFHYINILLFTLD